MPKYAAKMTWKEVEAEFNAGTLVIIPIGAGCKEHGLHMPNNTDQVHVDYYAEKIAHQLDVLIMPTVTYGYYPAFTHYAGSICLSLELCTEMFVQMCEQWHKQGAKAFYFLNYGISTNRPLESAQKKLNEKNITMRFSNLMNYYSYIEGLIEQEGGTHAEEVETSVMLAINPDLVNMELAQKDFDDKPGALVPFKPPADSDLTYSPTGAWGDPTLATVEKGKIFTERKLQFFLDDIAAHFDARI